MIFIFYFLDSIQISAVVESLRTRRTDSLIIP
jgi:hypothetical protein